MNDEIDAVFIKQSSVNEETLSYLFLQLFSFDNQENDCHSVFQRSIPEEWCTKFTATVETLVAELWLA